MKCIEVNGKTGIEVVRVKDSIAEELVKVGRAKYTNKQEWKETGRKYMEDNR